MSEKNKNFLKRAYSFFFPNKKVNVSTSTSSTHLRGLNVNRSFITSDLSAPELCSTVYACTSLIAGNIAKLKLHVYRKTKKGKEIFHNHPWEEVIAYSPDGRISTSKWLHYCTNNMLFDGGAYFYKQEYRGLHIERALKPLGNVVAAVEKEGEIWYKFDNVDTWLPSKDIIFPYIFSRDSVTPISPIQAIRSELNIQKGAETTVEKFFQNSMFRWLIVQADHTLADADKQKAKEWFARMDAELASAENAYGDGGLIRIPSLYNVKQLQMPDLKYLEQAKYTEQRIASVFHVPSFMLNIQEGGSSLKTSEQALQFKNSCLSPIASAILSELNAKLLTVEERRKGIFIDFDYSGLYDLDLESKAKFYTELFRMGSVNADEVREAFGLSALDHENGKLHFIQKQYYPLEWYEKDKMNKVDAEQLDNNENL